MRRITGRCENTAFFVFDMERHFLELLSPARDLSCGIAAIDHGADAVYIGAPMFGARKAAANTLEDIKALTDYAHLYGARVFCALNTLLHDSEIQQAVKIAWQLYEIGVDALIIQDMGLLECNMPPIELHASTQMDNRNGEKVSFLEKIGFQQVVLARELTKEQIKNIANNTNVRLECFIHGALCVSYSGRCFMSQCINGRSANRGECGQPCRLAYNLKDNQGNVMDKAKHLLSLRDFNLSENLEDLIDAGTSTFKIEGRLKDKNYVANITLHYRRLIDEIISRRPEFKRSSSGITKALFEPCPEKSFNRGFTSYFFNGRQRSISQPLTPKSFGEHIGKAIKVQRNSFEIDSNVQINNGDGLCFINSRGEFEGFNVNRTEGKRIFPRKMGNLIEGTTIFRNADVRFEALLDRGATKRIIDINMLFDYTANGLFTLTITDCDGLTTLLSRALPHETANNISAAEGNLIRQLSKLGATIYECQSVTIGEGAKGLFIVSSELNAMRREAIDLHSQRRQEHFKAKEYTMTKCSTPYITSELEMCDNVINEKAKAFYERHGATTKQWGYERHGNYKGAVVMTTRHCIMHERGMCLKENAKYRNLLPLHLVNDREEYELSFNCKACEMIISKL